MAERSSQRGTMGAALKDAVEKNSRSPELGQHDLTTSAVDTGAIDRFLAGQRLATPCIVLDLDIVRARYRALQAVLPTATILYAVKANPAR